MVTHPSISAYFEKIFHGRIQKIAVNAGLGCPNRDGTLGTGGCIFCNNEAFVPRYAGHGCKSITQQIEDGIRFFSRKGAADGYLIYFQSFSNTYGDSGRLISIYEEALTYPGVKGLVIATRPDCLADDLLDWFGSRFGNKAPEGHPYLLVELGVESTNDRTLERIRRGHDSSCSERAIRALAERGIPVGAHIILGLPGESREDFILHAERLSRLPVTTVKLHHLQIIEGTALAEEYVSDPGIVHLFTPDEYIDAVREFLAHLRKDIVVDRIVSESPKALVIAPSWGLKPSELGRKLVIPDR